MAGKTINVDLSDTDEEMPALIGPSDAPETGASTMAVEDTVMEHAQSENPPNTVPPNTNAGDTPIQKEARLWVTHATGDNLGLVPMVWNQSMGNANKGILQVVSELRGVC